MISLFSVAVATMVVYFNMLSAEKMLDDQIKRNKFLQNHTNKLEQTRAEIIALEGQKNDLVSRISIIQNLQISRPKVTKILDAIPKVIPDGVYIEKMQRAGNQFTLNGVADSNPLISIFMRKLAEHPEFEDANLEVVERNDGDSDGQSQKFTLLVYESVPELSEPDTEIDMEI